jgi:hypothetical protein
MEFPADRAILRQREPHFRQQCSGSDRNGRDADVHRFVVPRVADTQFYRAGITDSGVH